MARFGAIVASTLCLQTAAGDLEKRFHEFETKFEKKYESVEERLAKMKVFAENLVEIDRLTKVERGDATYSHLSPYADMSKKEFSVRFGFKSAGTSHDKPVASSMKTSTLPDSFDWRSKNCVNAVKNQEQCGSCWAFSAVDNIEGAGCVTTGKLLSLSEQELVDCDRAPGGDAGCQGGLPSNAFKYLMSTKKGMETETNYPYTSKDTKICKATASAEKVFVGGWTAISTNEDQIAAALMKYGPLAIGINAGPMQTYNGGVMDLSKSQCDPSALDHGVAIVGFGKTAGIFGFGKKNYWIIRNSWGASWGEKGYIRIARGKGTCGLNTDVSTATNITIPASTITDDVEWGCSGSGDPVAGACYEGSAGALGVKETVKVNLKKYASGAGSMDLTGTGIKGFTCGDHAFTKSGQDVSADLSDCLPKGVTVPKLKYCSTSDTIAVTVKDSAVPIPISTTLKKVTCPSTIVV